MAKFVYYTDLHHGPDVLRTRKDGVDILGSYATCVHEAVLSYAQKEGIKTILHGGDETTFHPIETKWLERAFNAAALMRRFSGHMIRVLGNHDYDEAPHLLGLPPNSFLTNIEDTLPAYILQPSCRHTGEKWLYEYSKKAANRLEVHKSEIEKHDTLILAGHWAFDRIERGYPALYDKVGYAYQDRADPIKAKLQEFDLSHILTLHGHEHRFVLSTTPATKTSAKMTHLIMPSIVQHDINDETKPCGLFVVIDDESDNGKLSLHFKKVVLSDDRKTTSVQDVTRQEMKAYKRPVRFDSEHNVPKY
ncbi:MAG: metallophosphoesterase [Alphaproteobacteria bacterium]|nr:metallophosphoesterase [Alphaproteobacteria bacterium]